MAVVSATTSSPSSTTTSTDSSELSQSDKISLGVGLGVGLGLGIPTILAALFFGYLLIRKNIREEVRHEQDAHDAGMYRALQQRFLTAPPQDRVAMNRLIGGTEGI